MCERTFKQNTCSVQRTNKSKICAHIYTAHLLTAENKVHSICALAFMLSHKIIRSLFAERATYSSDVIMLTLNRVLATGTLVQRISICLDACTIFCELF